MRPLPYFNWWQIPIPGYASPDRNSAFAYSFAGVRDLALEGYTSIDLEGQDDFFEVMETRIPIDPEKDVMVGQICFRSEWGTLRLFALRGKERTLLQTVHVQAKS